MCVCSSARARVCIEVRVQSWLSSLHSLHLIFEVESLAINLELLDLAHLASQQMPEVFLSLPAQQWCAFEDEGFGDSNSGLRANTLSTKPSLQPRTSSCLQQIMAGMAVHGS